MNNPISIFTIALVLAAAVEATCAGPTAYGGQAFPDYAGSESCRACHRLQYERWASSGHGLAERQVRPGMDRGAFEPQRAFRHGPQTTEVRAESGRFQIVAPGSGTNPQAYQVERVIGHGSLRQFLSAAPGGRWQAHTAAFDPASGQWFDVYGDEDRRPGEWGHWTGRGMNWNSRCADCHNTRLRKNYDPAGDTYHTTIAEMGVGCEACHGPLRKHVEWRASHPKAVAPGPAPPLVRRSQTLDVCASCHARRENLTGNFQPGDSFFDHYSLDMLDDSDRWYADGQVKDEDYEFAAFLGSRMYESGVHCRDCHRSDSGQGNALCLRCHAGGRAGFAKAPVIDAAEHGHHKLDDKGGECIGCHMPVTVYMQRDARHDHGFTAPDPLLSKQLAIPNACNRCHKDKDPDWALGFTEKWYGAKMSRHARERTQWVAAAQRGAETSRSAMIAMLADGKESAYWRAAAANLLWRWAGRADVQTALLARLKDEHPLVREKAVRALEPAAEGGAPQVLDALKTRLTDDPVRSVRVAAAWALRAGLDLQSRAGLELEQALRQDADQPTGQHRRALLLLAHEQPADALAHLQKAVSWDPFSPPLRYETAMLLSQLGRPAEALHDMEQAERMAPEDPQIIYGLAVVLARCGRFDEARAAAERALKIFPDFEDAKQLLQQLRAGPRLKR